MADFTFPTTLNGALKGAKAALILVPAARAKDGWVGRALPESWQPILEKALKDQEAGPNGKAIATVNPGEGPDRLVVGLLPDKVSRHNNPARIEAVAAAAGAADLGRGPTAVIACLEDADHALAVARGVARCAPLFSRATNGRPGGKRKGPDRSKRIAFLGLDTDGAPLRISPADQAVVHQSRFAASLVDTPTADMTTADFEKAAKKAARGIEHLKVTSIVGKALLEKKLGGLHAVGRTAMVPPRLLLLEYKHPKAKRKVAIVGKGIVYDTGGLSLKSSAHMTGMKADMGGAAAAVGATLALAESKAKLHVICAAALAENAIGPDSYRPDDILEFHSGKTVEINNTDAEGRLVLADAVSFIARKHKPAALLEAATLTGAQLVATGYRHAGVVSNREGLERLAVEVGRDSGDLAAPLPFAPEFFQEEFRSKVADMKNSVANRMNAQSSCAAQFIYSHIQDLDLPWLHVDLAGPAFRDERATGYGVALLAGVARSLDDEALAS